MNLITAKTINSLLIKQPPYFPTKMQKGKCLRCSFSARVGVIHWYLLGLQTKIKPQMVPQEPAKIISPLKMLINTEKDFKNPLI